MKGKLRYIGIAIGLLLLVLIALPFLINVNVFRPVIEQRLSASLGRKVHVGDLSLSILKGTLTAGNLSIAGNPGFSQAPFLTARSLRIGVELWPLVTSKTLNITGITIEQPEVVLMRNAQGDWNFAAPAGSSSKASAPTAGSDPTNASSKSQHPASPAGKSQTEYTVARLALEQGRVVIGSKDARDRIVYNNVNLEASNVSQMAEFPVYLTADLPGGGSFSLKGRIGPLNQSDVTLSPLQANLTLNDLDLSKTGLMGPRASSGGFADVTATFQSQAGRARAQGSVRTTKLQLAKGGGPSGVPLNLDFQLDYDLFRKTGVVNHGVVKIGKAVSRLSGTFRRQGGTTVVDFKLNGENLPVQDLQAALPAFGLILPKGSSLQAGTINASLISQGPLDKLITTGNVGLFDATLSGFDIVSKMAALPAFSGIAKGAPDTSIRKLTSDVRVAPGGTEATNVELVIPAIGQLNGGGTISSSNALNLKMVATLSAQSGLASTLGTLTGRRLSKDARIPFYVQGTKSEPKFVPDARGIVAGLIESRVGTTPDNNPQTLRLPDALGRILNSAKKKTK